MTRRAPMARALAHERVKSSSIKKKPHQSVKVKRITEESIKKKRSYD